MFRDRARKYLEQKDILHFKYANPLNPYRGLSPVKAAELAIATDKRPPFIIGVFKNSSHTSRHSDKR